MQRTGRNHIDDILLRIAGGQHGLVARWQCTAHGVDRFALARRVNNRRLVRLLPDVFAVGIAARTFEARCMAAVLQGGPGAYVSGMAAAFLRRALRSHLTPRTIVVVTRWRRMPIPGVRFVRSELPAKLHRHLGIPLADIPRMLVDLCDTLSRHRLTNVLYELEKRGYVNLDEVEAYANLAGRGHRVARLRFAIRRRRMGHLGSMSELEERSIRSLGRLGQSPPWVNPPVETDIGVLYVDLVWRSSKVCVEIDGDHTSIEQVNRDAARDAALARSGWIVLRFDADDVALRANMMARVIEEARLRDPRRLRPTVSR